MILIYALINGYQVDLGKIVEESILEYAKGNFLEISPTIP